MRILVWSFPSIWSVNQNHGELKRANNPAAFTNGNLPVWQFAAYTLFTQGALATFGVFIVLKAELADWLGWLMLAAMGILFVVYLVFKDMSPFVYYLLTLFMGVMIYRMG